MSGNVPMTYFRLSGPPHQAAEDMDREYKKMQQERDEYITSLFGARKVYTRGDDRVVAFERKPREQPPRGMREKKMDVADENGSAGEMKLFVLDKRTKIGREADEKLSEMTVKSRAREQVAKAMGLQSTFWMCNGRDGRQYFVNLSLHKFDSGWVAGVATHVLTVGEERGREDSKQKVIKEYCQQIPEWQFMKMCEEELT